MTESEPPNGMPPDIWDILVSRNDTRDYLENEPHPVIVRAVPCSGNLDAENEKGHAWQVQAEVWTWGQTDLGWGQWSFDKPISLTGWIPKAEILPSYEVQGSAVETWIGDSHGLCDDCEAKKPK